jgi:hypothetical protein
MYETSDSSALDSRLANAKAVREGKDSPIVFEGSGIGFVPMARHLPLGLAAVKTNSWRRQIWAAFI